MLHSVAHTMPLLQVAHQGCICHTVLPMITELREDWKSWHRRFKVALDLYKERTGETDEDIASKAGASRSSITHWKVGRRTPQLNNFFSACEVIGVDPAYVLFGSHSSQPMNWLHELPSSEMNGDDGFIEHEAEVMLLRALLLSLVDEHPNKPRLIARFQGVVQGMTESAPPEIDPELIVEVRARLQVYLALLGD